MATIEEVRKQLEKAEEEHGEAKKKLERLDKLKRKKVEEEYEGEKGDLEREKGRLEKKEDVWGKEVLECRKKIREFEEKGNEQIA